ncbi:DUF1716-domain-containing protein [Gonapodya prolifera JEL478]|uniref:DUF1716-domain-containing protein n=1 Tax=Gonapodya prolifera (strain JEL478) TaxID=1344416 RepID=A0A139AXA5_GONPJ|nr:DUF1716-domain-containing protein [Gonapodya prolifera JEL478]|eukprot:KXS21350.1 DUF1716-domain-containing protein [Gonapodya prolifera JEL478]
MNIDDLFTPRLPPKRKIATKELTGEPPKRLRGEDGSQLRTQIEDVEDGENGVREHLREDDEEDGRFYEGSGLSERDKGILDVVDEPFNPQEPAALDIAAVRKLVLKCEKAFQKNQDMRIRHADDPTKFMDSETDLDEHIHALMAITSAPHLYPELVRLNFIPSVVALVSHENTDISLAAVDLLNEMTDEEVVPEDGEEQEAGMKEFVSALVENTALEVVVQNMARLDEDQEEDKKGVFNSLSFIENAISVDASIAESVVRQTGILSWLLKRIRAKAMDSNRQYASEMLAVLLQSSRDNRLKLGNTTITDMNGVDIILSCLSPYKRRDPKDDDEVEFMENLFDALCSALNEPEIKVIFLNGEGLELMLILLKEKLMSRMRALKVVDYALTSKSVGDPADPTPRLAERWVDILGLKTLFAVFMRRGAKKFKKEYKAYSEKEEDEHAISIIASLFRYLAAGAYRDRLLFKFEEEDFEKCDHLALTLWCSYLERAREADVEIEKERKRLRAAAQDVDEVDEEEFLLRRLDAGLFHLQILAEIIAFLFHEGAAGTKEHLGGIFAGEPKTGGVERVREVLQERLDVLGPEDSESAKSTLQMLLSSLSS